MQEVGARVQNLARTSCKSSISVLEFSRSLYLCNHLSESIHSWTKGILHYPTPPHTLLSLTPPRPTLALPLPLTLLPYPTLNYPYPSYHTLPYPTPPQPTSPHPNLALPHTPPNPPYPTLPMLYPTHTLLPYPPLPYHSLPYPSPPLPPPTPPYPTQHNHTPTIPSKNSQDSRSRATLSCDSSC